MALARRCALDPLSTPLRSVDWGKPQTPLKRQKKMSDTDKQNRTKRIIVRLTEQEHQRLLDKKTKAGLATWIRETCLDSPTDDRKAVKTADPKLLAQLAKIGGNLNQIAKQANTLDSDLEKIRAFGLLAQIQSQLDELLEQNQ